MVAIFTVEEAREFSYQGQTPLSVEADFSDEVIQAAADRITQDFAQICGVAFVPTTVTRTLTGAGYAELLLPDAMVTSVATVATWNGDDFEAFGGTYRLLDDDTLLYNGGRWSCRQAGVRVTYTHGYATPPDQVKRAALILAVNDLQSSNVSDRATQQTNQFGTYNLAVAGWREGQWYGLPPVDSVLARYSRRTPMVG